MTRPFAVRLARLLVWCSLAVSLGASVDAIDWPQYLGPTRNGVYTGPPLSEKWPATGPRVVWKKTVGAGLSGPVIIDAKTILFHRVGDREVVEALNAATGATVWQYGYPPTDWH